MRTLVYSTKSLSLEKAYKIRHNKDRHSTLALITHPNIKLLFLKHAHDFIALYGS